MADFSTIDVDQIVAACKDNLSDIENSFNGCFESSFRIEVGSAVSWDPKSTPEGINSPGIAVAFEVGEEGMFCLVPSSLPLPDWYTEPNDSQSARLQTLAMEWSMQMLPVDLEASRFTTIAAENLEAELLAAHPVEDANFLELLLFAEGSEETAAEEEAAPDDADSSEDASNFSETGEPIGRIHLVWPIANPPFPIVAEDLPEESFTEAGPITSATSEMPAAPAPGIDQLRALPVPVSVRLAEKKIEVTQLMGLSQGALITFNKPCEDLLDLYVNNRLCFRGEAVKIGEKFGLKINEVDAQEIKEEKIING